MRFAYDLADADEDAGGRAAIDDKIADALQGGEHRRGQRHGLRRLGAMDIPLDSLVGHRGEPQPPLISTLRSCANFSSKDGRTASEAARLPAAPCCCQASDEV